jgi:ferric-dicitrate binding protein FerR (iron transport regulator)
MNASFTVLDEFEQLTAAVLDGTATPAERARFNAISKEYPEFRSVWLEQVRLHALLTCRGGGRCGAQALRASSMPPAADGGDVSKIKTLPARVRFALRRSWRAAAAAALVLGGVAVWQSVPPISVLRPPISVPCPPFSVALVRQSRVKGLDLPDTLPGALRLESGEIVVRLSSGVELIVLGPSDLEIRDCMQVSLKKGRLLANVPRWATGFRVRTSDLDVYDMGTVFSVSVDWPISDVFVFKGRVRVDEAAVLGGTENATPGECVGICEAGEGVRAEAGERPVKFAADWPAAKKLFASVRDKTASEKPAAAVAFAQKIADLWVDAYLPRELARLEERRLAAASAAKIPFRKTAWVRPAASAQLEERNMNSANAATALAAAAVMMGTEMAGAVSETIQVETSPCTDNRRWSTVFTNEVPLRWNWVANATKAELEIKGMNGSFTTNFEGVASNCLWRVFASNAPSAEDTYALTLTFFNSGSAVVGALTSQLAVVTGAFGETSVNPNPSDSKWAKVKENAVIPYDATWAEATASATNSRLVIAKTGGATQTNAITDASGYFGWKIKRSDWGYGTFNLALTFPGTVTNAWDAVLMRPMDGTMIRMQ